MNLYLVQYGQIDNRHKPYKFQIKSQEHVWANSKQEARNYGIEQHKHMVVKAEEVYAALKVPEMVIYEVKHGKVI